MNRDLPEPFADVMRTSAPTIVVGFDGSPASLDALAWAGGEARRAVSRLVVVYVVPAADAPAAALVASGSCGYVIEEALAVTARAVEDEALAEAQTFGVPVDFVRAHGDRCKELVRIAESAAADLVVVGRSTRKHLTRSLGAKLAAKRRAPTVVVVP